MNRAWIAPALAGLGIVAAGCAPRHNAALDAARAAYQDAAADPAVTANAAGPLRDAEQAVRRAETEWADDHDADETSHLAYVASRRVEIARAVAARETARAHLDAAATGAPGGRPYQTDTVGSARRTDRGEVVSLDDALFEPDEATLRPEADRRLDDVASFLRDHPSRDAIVEGYAEGHGGDRAQSLAQRRANAVRDYLVRAGVDPAHVVAQGYGDAYPPSRSATGTGRLDTRRVDVVILREGDVAAQHVR